jgi:hypothetical protein
MIVALSKLGLSAALIALLAPAAAQSQTDPALWRFVYPGAKAVISINWQRIRQSPAVAMLREKLTKGSILGAIPGVELLDDIDRILISSPGNPKAGDPDAAPAQPPVLIAIHGHFEKAGIRQFFTRIGAKAQAYNSFQVFRPQGKSANSMAWVQFDADTILLGDPPTLFATLDRNQFGPPAPEPGSISARAAEMEAAYEFWVVMSAPDMLSNQHLEGLFHGSELVADTQGFEAGINLRAGLLADVTVHFGSEESAKQVITQLTRVLAAASKDKGTESEMREMAKKVHFTADGATAKISLRLTPQELEKSAQVFAASHKDAMRVRSSAGSDPGSPAFAAAAPSKPGVIRIEGLDDGPREIPLPAGQH